MEAAATTVTAASSPPPYGSAAATASTDVLECDYAALPEDVLVGVYMLLPPYSLRSAAASNKAWCHALRRAPVAVRSRAAWHHRWTMTGAGACLQRPDTAVCTGGGTWTPGGVALATSLHLSAAQDSGFRLVVEEAAPGDLLMGITLHEPDTPPVEELLQMGYHFMMGRRIDAEGNIEVSSGAAPGAGGGVAPRSILYGGRSRRCCAATPTAQSNGLAIDMGPDGHSPGTLAKLRHVGDWVEFSLVGGTLRAADHLGQSHAWRTRVEPGEIWVPTLAWTGSRSSVRLAPPALSVT